MFTINKETVMTLYDRKKKHFNASQTKLRFLLLILRNYCIENNIHSVKFINDNISHYDYFKFNNMLGNVFHESFWKFDFVDSIVKKDIFVNVDNNFHNNVKTNINAVSDEIKTPYKTPFIKLDVVDIPTVALIDSGATSSVIDDKFIKKHNIPIECNAGNFKLFDVNGKPLNIKGICYANLKIGNEYFQERLFVVSNANLNQPVIICCPFLEVHGFLMDFRNKSLIHDSNVVDWIPPDCIVYNEVDCVKLKLDKDINIKPRSAIQMRVEVNNSHLAGHYSLQCTNKAVFKNNCHIPDTQVEGLFKLGDDNCLDIKIVNCSSMPKNFVKYTELCQCILFRESPAVAAHCDRLYNVTEVDKSSDKYFSIEKIINNVDCKENLKEFKEIIQDNIGAFAMSDEDVGLIKNYEHYIETVDDVPVACKPFRTPHSKIKVIEEEIQRLKRCGIIRESTSAYAAPCLIVYKKSGAPRLVIDFRKINQKIVPIRYPLPLLESSLQLLGGNKYFSSLDLLSGYHQYPFVNATDIRLPFRQAKGYTSSTVYPLG